MSRATRAGFPLTEHDANPVHGAVVGEPDARTGRRAVELDERDAPGHPMRVLDRDLVACGVVPEADLEADSCACDWI
jgi:hypothetical protein